jgi:hypothetical protein
MHTSSDMNPVPLATTSSASLHFLVGQDRLGHWLAIETGGHAGGLFTDRISALRYASAECGYRPDAVELVEERLELPI